MSRKPDGNIINITLKSIARWGCNGDNPPWVAIEAALLCRILLQWSWLQY